jgi:hypothetical protein
VPHCTEPPGRGIEAQVEVRLNNQLLDGVQVEKGWLLYQVNPVLLAVGENLVGVRVTQRSPEVRGEVLVEKLELQVQYSVG